jgi:hypothetical protein
MTNQAEHEPFADDDDQEPVENILKAIEDAMHDSDELSSRFVGWVEGSTEAERALIDSTLIYICGWSYVTLTKQVAEYHLDERSPAVERIIDREPFRSEFNRLVALHGEHIAKHGSEAKEAFLASTHDLMVSLRNELRDYQPPKSNILQAISAAMYLDDDGYRQSYKTIDWYNSTSDAEKTIIDSTLCHICGSPFKTRLESSEYWDDQ